MKKSNTGEQHTIEIIRRSYKRTHNTVIKEVKMRNDFHTYFHVCMANDEALVIESLKGWCIAQNIKFDEIVSVKY